MGRSTTDILKEAILLERRGKEFYAKVAEKSDSKSARAIFEMMAEEEDQHIKYLSVQFAHFSRTNDFIAPGDIDEGADDEIAMQILSEGFKKEVGAASFEAAAISAAIDFETRAVKLYSERAEEAESQNEKDMYSMLAKWEMGHQKSLHELNDSLKEDIWNDNNFWPF
ncbi:MAG: ferritin family protein [Flavobacteriales bacterium]|nr:ferritin family protein [Flavobacteriales bacterium]